MTIGPGVEASPNIPVTADELHRRINAVLSAKRQRVLRDGDGWRLVEFAKCKPADIAALATELGCKDAHETLVG